MRRVIILLLTSFVLILSACDNGIKSFEKRIVAQIKACANKSNCLVSIGDITDFKWDTLYVFKYNATYNDVQKAIGTKPPNYTEITRKIIFTLKGSIVYFEELPTDVSGVIENEVVFNIPDTKTYKSYTIDSANFHVTSEEIRKGEYFYELNQIKK